MTDRKSVDRSSEGETHSWSGITSQYSSSSHCEQERKSQSRSSRIHRTHTCTPVPVTWIITTTTGLTHLGFCHLLTGMCVCKYGLKVTLRNSLYLSVYSTYPLSPLTNPTPTHLCLSLTQRLTANFSITQHLPTISNTTCSLVPSCQKTD